MPNPWDADSDPSDSLVPSEQEEPQLSIPGGGVAHPRILGLDVGSKTIGLAVSDLLGITAQGLNTIRRQNKRVDYAALAKIIREYAVTEIVVGYPLRMSGEEGRQSEKMHLFADEIRKKFELPVHLWDERLTSAQANRLLRETEMSIKRRSQVVDQMAAVLILQGWMDGRENRQGRMNVDSSQNRGEDS